MRGYSRAGYYYVGQLGQHGPVDIVRRCWEASRPAIFYDQTPGAQAPNKFDEDLARQFLADHNGYFDYFQGRAIKLKFEADHQFVRATRFDEYTRPGMFEAIILKDLDEHYNGHN